MTVINHDTGEIVETIGAERARRLTTEAQNEFSSSRDHFDQGWAKIEEAVTGGGHLDLGYRSPGDYLHAEFDGVLAGLDIASRRIAVKTMTAWGLSTRAVAAPLAISEGTVRNDLQVRNPTHLPPIATPDVEDSGTTERSSDEAPVVVHPEGESFPPAAATPAADEGEPDASPARAPVVGIDGKTYSPTPKRQAQRDDAEVLLNHLCSLADRAAREASKLTPAQIARVTPKADLWTVGLGESLETLQRLLTSLTEEK